MNYQTKWRMTGFADRHLLRHGLNVIVTVDTTAVPVIDAIELAAENAGIVLERVEDETTGTAT